jgi:hypothetical protein
VTIRLEISSELADLAPALEIVVRISVRFERDNLGKVAEEQRKCPPGSHNADSHIVFIQHKDVTVQAGFVACGNHSFRSLNYSRWLIAKSDGFGKKKTATFVTVKSPRQGYPNSIQRKFLRIAQWWDSLEIVRSSCSYK